MSNEPNIVIDIVETDIGEIYGYCPECEVNKGRHASMVSPLWSFCPFCGSEITFPKPIMDDYKVIKCDWCGNDIAKKYSYAPMSTVPLTIRGLPPRSVAAGIHD